MKKQFNVEQYGEAKVVAKELGINVVGKSKQTLVDLVNAKLAEQNKVSTAKWHDDIKGYEEGKVVTITLTTMNKKGEAKNILANRTAQIVGFSRTQGKLRVILFNENGELQKCIITVEIDNVVLNSESTKESEVA